MKKIYGEVYGGALFWSCAYRRCSILSEVMKPASTRRASLHYLGSVESASMKRPSTRPTSR